LLVTAQWCVRGLYLHLDPSQRLSRQLFELPSQPALIECKSGDNKPHRALIRFAGQFPDAEAVQLVHSLRQEEFLHGIAITDAATWLSRLAA